MHDKKGNLLLAKSFTGIYDIFGLTPFYNVLYQNKPPDKKDQKETEAVGSSIGDCDTFLKNESLYVTSEKYHGLNKQLSTTSMHRSTSTLFYDLDDVAKRHSFNCLTESCFSNANILKVMKLPTVCGFTGKSNPVVQECATQIKPKMLARNSTFHTKRIKNKLLNNDLLTSSILLKDNCVKKQYRNNLYYNIDVTNPQKFWSYAKYRSEPTSSPTKEKKSKNNKDKGKRTEDPCPCQLFSYACPCTDEKSLTELANNSKYLSVAVDKITSTTVISIKKKKLKDDTVKEHKLTNTNMVKNEPEAEVHTAQKQDAPIVADNACMSKHQNNSQKKPHKMVCPKCNEKVETISITEDEDSLLCNSYNSKELPPTAAYNCSTSFRSNRNKFNDGDTCIHEPPCELIPVCQVLPADDNNEDQNNTKRKSPKSRVIRITKACRHHPPCTVVPLCQRATVLRNNCGFIPACLHRPRCVNLPLCVPLPKNINYDELVNKHVDEVDSCTECLHIPRCKLIPVCQSDSLTKNTEQHYNLTTHNCGLHEFNASTYIISPKPTFLPYSPSPNEIYRLNSPCCSCKSNKSCQFNYFECQVGSVDNEESADPNGVIFIRDVGCQFQNKSYSIKDTLLHSKTSSASFDYNNKSEQYYANFHTARYEDKFTNPISTQDPISTDSTISAEIDSNCPSHGRERYPRNQHCDGFQPKSAFVTAYAKLASKKPASSERCKDIPNGFRHRDMYSTKSRRCFLKGKCRKMFTTKRRRGSRTSSQFLPSDSRMMA